MQNFVGTKQIQAKPMTRQEYNDYRGWQLPSDENGNDVGYLVEYLDSGKSNHQNHKGYISWSPKGVFEAAYKPTTGMTFGLALECLKQNMAVARQGWNGKNMFLVLYKGQEDIATYFGYGFGEALGEFTFTDVIAMKTADNKMVLGWLASQTDMLSSDWFIVENK